MTRDVPRTAAICVDLANPSRGYPVCYETPEWEALLEWCRFHGIDPRLVPAGSAIVRNAERHTIAYLRIVVDEDGRRQISPDGMTVQSVWIVDQGEAGPLPFPAEVLGLAPPPVVGTAAYPDSKAARRSAGATGLIHSDEE